jgi:hypothetical protein
VLPSFLAAQNDSIYVTVNQDSVTIWHTSTLRNCASAIVMDVQVDSFEITVLEVDTTSELALCDCLFDLSVTLVQLPSGQYTAGIYSTDLLEGDTLYWGSVTFTVTGDSLFENPLMVAEYQSPCGGSVAVTSDVTNPTHFRLFPVYPNPFNPRTTISYFLPTDGWVEMAVYDLSGKRVATLLDEGVGAGLHSIIWEASKFPSGLYFIVAYTTMGEQVQKAIMIK